MSNPTQGFRLNEAIEAVILTLIAGYVDGIGYLRLGGVYVANMSGNSVSVGLHAAKTEWGGGLQKALPIGCYVLGLILTRMAVRIASRSHFRRIASLTLTIEVALLVLFIFASGEVTAIVFAALAMGIQAGTLTRFNRVTVYTAFVTGSLVKFADSLSGWIVSGGPDDPERKRSLRNAAWFLGVWLAYVSGAILGALRFASQGTSAVVWGCMGLAAIIALDICCPGEFESQA